MSRVEIDLPNNFLFETELKVRITDINYGNHLGNDAVLGLMHEARLQFLNSLGYSELDFGGNGIIMSDCAVQYKSEAFYGDVLLVKVGVNDIGRLGFDLIYQFINNKNQKTVVVGKTGVICFDYQKRKVIPLNNEVKQKLV